MASNRITEGVGKKIVEALKTQSNIEIQQVVENPAEDVQQDYANENNNEQDVEFVNPNDEFDVETPAADISTTDYDSSQNISENIAQQDMVNPMQFSRNSSVNKDSFAKDIDEFEVPSNIAVLKQLINRLPAGVSKQTGAQIIRQTMEALGISMKNVLQEAQQVQENLNNSTRECQASIMEYKRQIGILEKQSQKFQRQYSALNDIISLFIQTNL